MPASSAITGRCLWKKNMIHKHPLVSGGQGVHLGGVHAPSPSILRFKWTGGGLKRTRGSLHHCSFSQLWLTLQDGNRTPGN